MLKPYYQFMEGICRRNGWVLGEDKGDMVLGVAAGDGSQRSVIVLEFKDSAGQLGLRFWSPITALGKFPADQALKVNMQLPHGAIAEHNGQVVIAATRILKEANPSEVTSLLQAMAYFAAFYAKHYGGR